MEQTSVLAIVVIVMTFMVILQAFQEREIKRLSRSLDQIYDAIIGEINEVPTP